MTSGTSGLSRRSSFQLSLSHSSWRAHFICTCDRWQRSLAPFHTRVNFATTASRFLEALPMGLRAATVEYVREARDKVGGGRSQATRRQYELRIKSLLSYVHRRNTPPLPRRADFGRAVS